MPPELVERIAGESDENRHKRDELTKKLDILSKGSDFCNRFVDPPRIGKDCAHTV